MRLAAALLLYLSSACGDDASDPFADLVVVSATSPFEGGCSAGGGAIFRHAEVEPFLAVDPTDPDHLIGVWQEDRWSTGGAAGLVTGVSRDAGLTWTRTFAPFSHCAAGNAANGGDFERATDPWVTITPEGIAYQIGVSFDATVARNAILASRSTDGGDTWSDAASLIFDDDPDVFNDKVSITADPTRPDTVYAVWDRSTGGEMPMEPIGTGPVLFARAVGGVWEPTRVIYDPGIDAQTIGNVVLVLPDGTLVDLFNRLTELASAAPTRHLGLVRSTDGGVTWSPLIDVGPLSPVYVHDANDVYVRGGAETPSFAVDPSTGALAAVWEDARFSDGAIDGIAITRSTDGGLTWTAPAQVNQDRQAPAFLPAVAIAADGTIAVTYDDVRADDPDDRSHFMTTTWMATSRDGGASWVEEPLTGAFDLRVALLGELYFLGDYQGLAARGGGFVPFFTAARNDDDRTDLFVVPPAVP